MRYITALILALIMAACATPSSWERDSTARSVGCTPNEVRIVSKDSGSFDRIQSWYADCHGVHYRCVYVPGDRGGCYPVQHPG